MITKGRVKGYLGEVVKSLHFNGLSQIICDVHGLIAALAESNSVFCD